MSCEYCIYPDSKCCRDGCFVCCDCRRELRQPETNMLTDEQLAKLKLLATTATPGPWHADVNETHVVVWGDPYGAQVIAKRPRDGDAAIADVRLIAAARTHIADIIGELLEFRAAAHSGHAFVQELENARSSIDPLHPTGRCTCAGGGECLWCLMIAVKEERDALQAHAERLHAALSLAPIGGTDAEVIAFIDARRLVLDAEFDATDRMVSVNGSTFRCKCGCNVFRRSMLAGDRYRCNACGVIFIGEK